MGYCDLKNLLLLFDDMNRLLKFFIHVGKVFVGLVFLLSVVVSILFIVGFFLQGMPMEYLEKNGLMMAMSVFIGVLLAFPSWKWKKEIWEDIASLFFPF